ncbi:MAG: ArdC family protein, partial [Lentisphaerae bacterium]|nr:ArdC family protein [Lentisphaerota bacterium]
MQWAMVDPRSQAESSARNSTPPGTAKPQIPAGTADSQPSQSCIRCNIGGSGVNVVSLALEAIEAEHPTGWWSTYRQWSDLGAQVRKGERSTRIVKWVSAKRKDADAAP